MGAYSKVGGSSNKYDSSSLFHQLAPPKFLDQVQHWNCTPRFSFRYIEGGGGGMGEEGILYGWYFLNSSLRAAETGHLRQLGVSYTNLLTMFHYQL